MPAWEITVETKEKITLENPLFIEGLPGIGNVGKIAADFLVEEFKAKKLATFFNYKYPHSVFVTENNLAEMPKIELYYKKFDDKSNKDTASKKNGKRDLLLLVGDIQPLDEESCYSFCDEIIKIAKSYGSSEIIATGGIGLQQIPDQPKVYCTSNDKQLYEEYSKQPLIQKEVFGVVGPIVGVTGVLLGLGKKRNMKAVALLAETFAHPMYLGIKGAQELLRVFEAKFQYGIDLQKMTKEIERVEREVTKRMKVVAAEISATAGAKAKEKEMHYIG